MAADSEKPQTPKPLTPKERAFVLAYVGVARGNATRAARLAGYKDGPGLASMAYELLRKPHVRAAIDRRFAIRDERTIAEADEIDRTLSGIVRDGAADDFARIRAASELNKCRGRHSVTHHMKGRLTLEQVLGESRGADDE